MPARREHRLLKFARLARFASLGFALGSVGICLLWTLARIALITIGYAEVAEGFIVLLIVGVFYLLICLWFIYFWIPGFIQHPDSDTGFVVHRAPHTIRRANPNYQGSMWEKHSFFQGSTFAVQSSLGWYECAYGALAAEADWSYLCKNGTQGASYKRVQNTEDRVVFKVPFMILKASVVMLIGVMLVLGFGAVIVWLTWKISIYSALGLLCSPAGFAVYWLGYIACLLLVRMHPIIFDKKIGRYWGWWNDKNQPDIELPSHLNGALEDIAALQILYERKIHGEYMSDRYELNLILADGWRQNVFTHGDETVIQEHAKLLSDFLRVPIWLSKSLAMDTRHEREKQKRKFLRLTSRKK